MLPRSFSLALFVSLVGVTALADEAPPTVTYGPWTPEKDADAIVIERRSMSNTVFGEFRGRTLLDAPIERVFAVIQDADRRPEWMHDCVASRFVVPGEESQVLYNRTRAPWPVTDRDVVLRGTIRFDVAAKALWVLFESTTHPSEPPQKGVTRMRMLRGHWKLEPTAGGAKTQVEYLLQADAGGKLPAWAADIVAGGMPFHTLRKLRAQVKKASYPEYEAAFRMRPGYAEVMGLEATAPTTTASVP